MKILAEVKFKNEEAINNNKSEFNENITYGDNSKLIDKNESKIGKVTNLVLKINNSGKLFKIIDFLNVFLFLLSFYSYYYP